MEPEPAHLNWNGNRWSILFRAGVIEKWAVPAEKKI